jgi:hypothetical protein
MKGHFYFCDECDKREWARLPDRVTSSYTTPTGWVDVTVQLENSYVLMNFCSSQCAVTRLSEVPA